MKYLQILCLFTLVSCLPEATESEGNSIACSLTGSEDSMALKISTEQGFTLPQNITIAFDVNGTLITLDECSNNSLNDSSLFIDRENSVIAARFILEKNSAIRDFYFPNDSDNPIVDTAAFKVFKRANCSSSLELVSDRPNNVVTWLPEFANGQNCKKTSNTGLSSFKLIP